MIALDQLRERITERVARVIGFVLSLRREDLRQRVAALWSGRGRLGNPNALVAVALVLVIGTTVILSAWSPAGQAGERDFESPVICANCGHHYDVSRDAMFDQMTAARKKGFSAAGRGSSALGLCPKCDKFAIFRAVGCPKCGKPVAPAYAAVNGTPTPPKCAACGWSAKKSGG